MDRSAGFAAEGVSRYRHAGGSASLAAQRSTVACRGDDQALKGDNQ